MKLDKGQDGVALVVPGWRPGAREEDGGGVGA